VRNGERRHTHLAPAYVPGPTPHRPPPGSEPPSHIYVATPLRWSFRLEEPSDICARVPPGTPVICEPAGPSSALVRSHLGVLGSAPADVSAQMSSVRGWGPQPTFAGEVSRQLELFDREGTPPACVITCMLAVNTTRLAKVPLPAPPILAAALGYEGRARFVSAHYSVLGDELLWSDGEWTRRGDGFAWRAFTGHPYTAPLLADYTLDEPPDGEGHHLIIDRCRHTLYVAASDDARLFMRAAALLANNTPGALEAACAVAEEGGTAREDAAALFIEELAAGEDPLAGFHLVPAAGGGEVVAYIERRRRSTDRLIEWLDARAQSADS
jgi:hypothetical protein